MSWVVLIAESPFAFVGWTQIQSFWDLGVCKDVFFWASFPFSSCLILFVLCFPICSILLFTANLFDRLWRGEQISFRENWFEYLLDYWVKWKPVQKYVLRLLLVYERGHQCGLNLHSLDGCMWIRASIAEAIYSRENKTATGSCWEQKWSPSPGPNKRCSF